nr:hypothetical protein [Ktedonobacteraceae bacterium]
MLLQTPLEETADDPLFLHFPNFYGSIVFEVVLKICNKGHFYTDAGYHQNAIYLSDEEFVQFRQEINAALLPWLKQKPAPGRRRHLLTTILIPELEREGPENDENDPISIA